MAANTITIKLNDDQQKQIRDATGQTVTELSLEPVAAGQLSDQTLDGVVGGADGLMPLAFIFKLVAVKTVSWAHD